MSEKDYNTYVDDCLDKGYDSDYYRYDDSFHGTNNKHEKEIFQLSGNGIK